MHAGRYWIPGLTDAGGVGVPPAGPRVVVRYTYDAYGLPTVVARAGCVRGDSNCDGVLTFADIDAFVLALSGQAQWEAAYSCGYLCVNDVNGDGAVSFSDIDPFVSCLTQGGCGTVPGAPPNPYLFTGRRLDFDLRDTHGSVTGQPGRPLLVLYDYRAREYHPWHGRFCQRDPALYADSLNLYQYALSNPQGRLDPGGEFSFGDLMGAITTGARIYGWYETGQTIRQAIADFAAGVSLRNIMLDVAIGFAVDKAGAKMLDALVDVAGPLLKKQAMQFGRGWRKGGAEIAELRARAAARPMQRHHVVPKGGKEFGPQYEAILSRYDLSVLGDWNVRLMPHQGRHPDEYNDWILQELYKADAFANGDQALFLTYMQRIIEMVVSEPAILTKEWWR